MRTAFAVVAALALVLAFAASAEAGYKWTTRSPPPGGSSPPTALTVSLCTFALTPALSSLKRSLILYPVGVALTPRWRK